MIYRRTRQFKASFDHLPQDIQEKAKKAFSLFQEDQRHPSLRIKKMQGKDDVWEGSIDIHYRFTFHYATDPKSGRAVCVFRNIGPHNILDRSP